MFRDLLSFCLKSQWSGLSLGFTSFMCTASSRAIVQEGSIFSEEDKRSFYNYLEGQSQQDHVGDITVRDIQGGPFRIVVTITEKQIYGWRISEVNVDAIRLVAGVSMSRKL
jgi:hypothetical protein